MAKLKVFRTPIGFHDAYVAAPSQKAALAAWGSDHDLFARGAAELVTDAALIAGPLAQPGVVIKRLRGTAAEQIAALPADRPREPARQERPPKTGPKPRALPPPDRTKLEEAERRLRAVEERQRAEDRALADEEAALARRRRDLSAAHRAETQRLTQQRDAAQAAYERAVDRWRG